MRSNLRQLLVAAALASVAFACPVSAQEPIPPHLIVPPPPPIPPPKIEIQKIPKMDEIPTSPKLSQPQRGSFGDRVTRCIEEAAAAGLGPNERAIYSRACANQ